MNEIELIRLALEDAMYKVNRLKDLAELNAGELSSTDKVAANRLLEDLHPILIDCADNTCTLGQKLRAHSL